MSTKTPKLIGFPVAGTASNYTGHMADIEAERAAQAGAGARRYLAAYGVTVYTPQAGASLRFNGSTWAGAGIEPRRTDWGILPPDIGSMVARTAGDITGASGSKA